MVLTNISTCFKCKPLFVNCKEILEKHGQTAKTDMSNDSNYAIKYIRYTTCTCTFITNNNECLCILLDLNSHCYAYLYALYLEELN